MAEGETVISSRCEYFRDEARSSRRDGESPESVENVRWRRPREERWPGDTEEPVCGRRGSPWKRSDDEGMYSEREGLRVGRRSSRLSS